EPPGEQFGKLLSIPDSLIPEYLQYVTAWPQTQIDATLADLTAGALGPLDAKRLLARTVCDLYHGAGAGDQAQADFDRVFREHAAPREIPEFVLPPDAAADDNGELRLSRLLSLTGLAA